jgi:hypothetical protein
MASIMPIVIGCIDYLAYGSIFTRAMFRPKIKIDIFFPARKAVDARREVVWGIRSAFAVTTEENLGREDNTSSV